MRVRKRGGGGNRVPIGHGAHCARGGERSLSCSAPRTSTRFDHSGRPCALYLTGSRNPRALAPRCFRCRVFFFLSRVLLSDASRFLRRANRASPHRARSSSLLVPGLATSTQSTAIAPRWKGTGRETRGNPNRSYNDSFDRALPLPPPSPPPPPPRPRPRPPSLWPQRAQRAQLLETRRHEIVTRDSRDLHGQVT